MHADESKLSPLRTRLIAFAVLAVIALVSILLIDHRVMQRMDESEQQHRQQNAPTTFVEHTLV